MSTPAPQSFLDALAEASALSGVPPADIVEEALYMTPDGYILRADVPVAEESDGAIPAHLLPILDDMAASFGFTRQGLLLEMSRYIHKAAAALIAHDEERARAVREAGRVRNR